MINEKLIDKDRLIYCLNRKIEDFKKYDEDRKKYYSQSLRRLGELESFLEEMESIEGKTMVEKLRVKIDSQKRMIRSLEAKLRILNISNEEIESVKSDKNDVVLMEKEILDLRARIKKLEKENKNQKNTISSLIYKLNQK